MLPTTLPSLFRVLSKLATFQNFAFLSLLIFPVSSPAVQTEQKITKHICITQIAQHPSLDTIRKGILAALTDQGLPTLDTLSNAPSDANISLKITYDNPQGNSVLSAQIANKFANLSPDLMIAITTPSAQSLLRVAQKHHLPLLFTGVTDPLTAKLLVSLNEPNGYITGVYDAPPVEEQVRFIRHLFPKIKRLGALYNPGEINSVSQINELRTGLVAANISLIEATATRVSEVSTAALSLLDRCDAIFIPLDSTVTSGIETLIRLCLEQQIPLIASDDDSVKKGALGALCYDQYLMGYQTGIMAAHILRAAGQTLLPPPQCARELKPFYNPLTAEKIGFTLPQPLLPNS